MVEEENVETLKTGNYVIELSNGPSIVYKIEPTSGSKEWVCTCPEPEAAMVIIEGLILVENKRFHYPDSAPKLNFENVEVNESGT
jgi:hypothetical protein